jgi:uncharacterized protein (DUF2267 family)
MDAVEFIRQVAATLACDERRADAIVFAVFHELRDRLTDKESADVAAQLPTGLKRLWRDSDRRGRDVEKTHEEEFVGRVRHLAGLPDQGEAERAVRAVFAALQRLLGSPSGLEGEAWDVFSVLPKDLKKFWVSAAGAHPGG